MSVKSLSVFFALSFFVVLKSNAQDLLRKVPAESNLLITINNKAIFKHLNPSDVDSLFSTLGIFSQLFSRDVTVEKLEDLGIDFSSRAYLYGQVTDSVQYVGGLLPLADVRLFENLIVRDRKVEMRDGFKTIYSTDRTIRVSWDQNTVYVLTGMPMKKYFEQEELRLRYNLPADPYAVSYEAYDFDAVADSVAEVTPYLSQEGTSDVAQDVYADVAEDVAYPADTLSSEVYAYTDTVDGLFPTAPVPALPDTYWNDDYRAVDSVLAQDAYQDDYYMQYRVYEKSLDSAINVVLAQWVDQKMLTVLSSNAANSAAFRKQLKLSDNTILDYRLRNLDAILSAAYYPEALAMYYLTGVSNLNKAVIDHGIEELSGQIVVDGNKLILAGDATLDKEMTRYFKEIYGRKINPKFLRFLTKETLGFMSFNVHTESYIKHMPRIVDRYYGNLAPRYSDFVGLGTMLFDIMLDEKAISKVFKGDNLLLVDGVEQVEITYLDYEYDDNYDYKTVERTKKETVPDFLWMFSSDDFRVFEKLVQIGLNHDKMTDLGGIYKFKKGEREALQMYMLMKDGIVFFGNDLAKLEAIQNNQFRERPHQPYVSMAKNNSFSMVFNTSRLVDFVDELDLPVGYSMQQTINEMNEYGDFYVVFPGMKKNKLVGEMGFEFPATKGNALAFLLSLVERWTVGLGATQ